jgi:hypothetical protein
MIAAYFVISARSKTPGSAVDDVAVINESSNFSLQKTISAIEQRLNTAPSGDLEAGYDDDDDVMPAVANEMGAGGSARIFKIIEMLFVKGVQ